MKTGWIREMQQRLEAIQAELQMTLATAELPLQARHYLDQVDEHIGDAHYCFTKAIQEGSK